MVFLRNLEDFLRNLGILWEFLERNLEHFLPYLYLGLPGGVLPKKLGGGARQASWNSYPVSNQNLWFSQPYLRPDQKFDTVFQTWSPGARRVTGARDKLLRHVHGSCVNIKREMVLSPNDEEVANSSKKTRVHKPYPERFFFLAG